MYINLGSSSGATNHIRFFGTGNTEIVRFTNDGFVGIGAALPGYKLTVNGGAI